MPRFLNNHPSGRSPLLSGQYVAVKSAPELFGAVKPGPQELSAVKPGPAQLAAVNPGPEQWTASLQPVFPVGLGSGTQTPWLQDVDGAGFKLTNVSQIGVGTKTPGATLDVTSTTVAPTIRIAPPSTGSHQQHSELRFGSYQGSDLWRIAVDRQETGAQDLDIISGSYGPVLAMKYSTGRVGIGTETPANALDIGTGGGLHITDGTPSSVTNALYSVSGSLYWNGVAVGGMAGSGTVNYIPVFTSNNTIGNSIIYQSGAGNVGIGIANPIASLDLGGFQGIRQLIYSSAGSGYEMGFGVNLGQGSAALSLFMCENNGCVEIVAPGSVWPYTSYTTRFIVLANGNVGIGTATPSTKLEVQGDVNISGTGNVNINGTVNSGSHVVWGDLQVVLSGGSGRMLVTGTPSDNVYLEFLNAAANSHAASVFLTGRNGASGPFIGFQFDRSYFAGNVGIGTTTPAYKLDVQGDINITGNYFVNGVPIGTGGGGGGGGIAGSTGYISRFTSASTVGNSAIYQDGSGNIGIGTATPQSLLDVAGAGHFAGAVGIGTLPGSGQLCIAGSVVALRLQGDTSNNDTQIQFVDKAGGLTWAVGTEITATDGSKMFQFYSQASGPAVTLQATGNVGIGTTTPQCRLDFGTSAANAPLIIGTYTGSGFWSGIGMDVSTAALRLAGDPFQDTNPVVDFGKYSNDGNLTWHSYLTLYGTGGVCSLDTKLTAFNLRVQGSVKMTVTQSGNVGIGHPTPQWPLHVVGHVAIEQSDAFALVMRQGGPWGVLGVDGSGSLSFFDTNVNPKVTITQSGNVGIGTTAPTAKLEVAGDTKLIRLHGAAGTNGTQICYADHNGSDIWAIGVGPGIGDIFTQTFVFLAAGIGPILSLTPYGTVGIGTYAPQWPLDIASAGGVHIADGAPGNTGNALYSIGSILYWNGAPVGSGGGGGGIGGGGTAGFVPMFTSGSSLGNSVIYQTSGHIGIGTSPSYDLDVLGKLRVNTGAGGGQMLVVNSTYDDIYLSFSNRDATASAVSVTISGYNYGPLPLFYVEASVATFYDRVGLGTTNPEWKFHVVDGRALFSAASSNWALGLRHVNTDAVTVWLGSDANHSFQISESGGSPLVTVTQAGKVGIGTTTPAFMLDVLGDARVTGHLRVALPNGGGQLNLTNNPGDDSLQFQCINAAGNASASSAMFSGPGGTPLTTFWVLANTTLIQSTFRVALPNGGGQLLLANNANDDSMYLEFFNHDNSASANAVYITGASDTALPSLVVRANQTVHWGNLIVASAGPYLLLTQNGAATQQATIISTAGYSSAYNGTVLANNEGPGGSQANTGLPSWRVDVGGYDTPSCPGTQDAVSFLRKGAGGTAYQRMLSIYPDGGMIIASGVPASTGNALYNNNGTLMWNGAPVGGGSIGGSGTAGYVPMFTGAASIGNSLIYQSGAGIGIGITTPQVLLHVNGNAMIGGNTENYLVFSNAANQLYGGYILGRSVSNDDAQNFFIYDAVATTVRFFISSAGNVGIGTTAPQYLLHTSGGMALFEGNDNAWTVAVRRKPGSTAMLLGCDAADSLNIYDAAVNPRVTITQAGNVGIGTGNPTIPLVVHRNAVGGPLAYFDDSNASTQIYGGWIYVGGGIANAAADGSAIHLYGNGTEVYRNIADSTSCLRVIQNNAGSTGDIAQFISNGVTRAVVTQSGRLGIVNASPSYPLDVTGNVRINTGNNGGQVLFDNGGGADAIYQFAYNHTFSGAADGYYILGPSAAPIHFFKVIATYSSVTGNFGVGVNSPAWPIDIGLAGGIHIVDGVPSSTGNALYSNSGALYWNGAAIPTAANTVPSSRTISTTAPLTGGGDLSANRTFGVSLATASAVGVVKPDGTTITVDGTGKLSTVGGGGGITGSGAAGYIPLFTGASAVGTSVIYNTGGNVGIGITTPQGQLALANQGFGALVTYPNMDQAVFNFYQSSGNGYNRYLDIVAGGGNVGGSIRFITQATSAAGVVAMTVDPSGKVGIGVAGPVNALDVGTGGIHLSNGYPAATTNALYCSAANSLFFGGYYVMLSPGLSNFNIPYSSSAGVLTGSTISLNSANTSNVGIGITSPNYNLHLAIDSAAKPATNAWTITSDSRVKRNIRDLEGGLDIIAQLHPIQAEYNGLGGLPEGLRVVGFLAEEIRKVLPFTVGSYRRKLRDDDAEESDLLDFNLHEVLIHMVLAIQQLSRKVAALENFPGYWEYQTN